MYLTIFYLIGILFIFYELYCIFNTKKVYKSFESIKTEHITIVTIGPLQLINFFYTIWVLIGFFVNESWFIFIIISALDNALKQNKTKEQIIGLMIIKATGKLILLIILISNYFKEVISY